MGCREDAKNPVIPPELRGKHEKKEEKEEDSGGSEEEIADPELRSFMTDFVPTLT